jgi:predicted glycoside hydrolase/deacetylase ChbG (UPF0249 family)
MAVVINADDFGASPTINDSVISAYEFGTLRSASLLVTGAAAQQAVEMARRSPGLAVGLQFAAGRRYSGLLVRDHSPFG